MQALNRLIEQPLRLCRGVLAVKDIACHNQNVYLPLGNNLYQLVEYSGLFVLARIPAQGLPDVPISGMQNSHHCPITPILLAARVSAFQAVATFVYVYIRISTHSPGQCIHPGHL